MKLIFYVNLSICFFISSCSTNGGKGIIHESENVTNLSSDSKLDVLLDSNSIERFHFANDWGVSITDGEDTIYREFSGPERKRRFGSTGQCIIEAETQLSESTFSRSIVCPEFTKELVCEGTMIDPDEEAERKYCELEVEFEGYKILLSVHIHKVFNKEYWLNKTRILEMNKGDDHE